MPTLRRVPRVYHLRQSASASSLSSPIDSSTPSDPPPTLSLPTASRPITRSRSRAQPPPSTCSPCPPSSPLPAVVVPQPRRRPTETLRSSTIGLLDLPTELLHEIARLLVPPFVPEQWDEPADDFLAFASTCRRIRLATATLQGRQVAVRIDDSPGSLARAAARVRTLARLEAQARRPRIRKLYIKDDAGDLRAHGEERRGWYIAIAESLGDGLGGLEMFCYARNMERVAAQSPYELLLIDRSLLIAITWLTKLKTLYLCGLELHRRRTNWAGTMPLSLGTVHMMAVADTVLEVVRRCPGLRTLRIWRNFLFGYPAISDWLDCEQWQTLTSIQLKGFYGNEVIALQASLAESRRMATAKGLRVRLHTLDLDEPYTSLDALGLLEAFGSDELRVLRLTLWRDADFSPRVLERLAELFPALEELQLVLETPLRRWWPHKLHAWAHALSRFGRLKRFVWNCSPMTGNDYGQLRAGMKAQAMVLAATAGRLERVGFVDRAGWLEVDRRPDRAGVRTVRWAGQGLMSEDEEEDEEEDESEGSEYDCECEREDRNEIGPDGCFAKPRLPLEDPFAAEPAGGQGEQQPPSCSSSSSGGGSHVVNNTSNASASGSGSRVGSNCKQNNRRKQAFGFLKLLE